jgi:hypothetical protein
MSNDSIVSQLSLFDPIEIPLTKGYIALVDPVDADLAEYRWSALEYKCGRVYAVRLASTIAMHRVILQRMVDHPLVRADRTDHIKGIGVDNRRSNLRLATHAQNLMNRPQNSSNTSGYKGVSFNKHAKKWRAGITALGKTVCLGYFDTPELAYAAYCAAARELHGEFFNPGDTPTNGATK